MPAILVSIKNDVWKKMKKYPEIKWTQVMRASVEDRLDQMEGSMSMEQIREWLGPELIREIRKEPRPDPVEMQKKIKESEWRRLQLLTQARMNKARKG
ncbi:hypothetical protein HY994_04375 [Candidatus Micrarchaeota archaeon]|nr:hypothetical protein [Candidatus Micrarchaeota archaeon]